jgi:hypothetical protein
MLWPVTGRTAEVNGFQRRRRFEFAPRGDSTLASTPDWNVSTSFQLSEGECVIMASIFGREDGPRWPRGQKFRLSAMGTEAEAQYQAAVKSSHDRGGREAFDEAVATWAAPFGVRPGDGVYLSELRISVQTLTELAECLISCGSTKSEAKAALERLLTAKLAELVAP